MLKQLNGGIMQFRLLPGVVAPPGVVAFCTIMFLPISAFASGGGGEHIDLTTSYIGYIAVALFSLAYIFVMAEEYTHLRKSKPVILAAGIIWAMIALAYSAKGDNHTAETVIRHNFLEFSELFFFLLVAMTYIAALEERLVFETLRAWLVKKGFGFRKLFWITGVLAFFISPVADNLTTALLMCAVVMAVGVDNPKFVSLACINIVVAANAGGAFSPFGDITTLMVWQKGLIHFWTFFLLFIPSVVNFIIPAAFMHFAIEDIHPEPSNEVVVMKRGGFVIMFLFLATIVTAVSFHQVLHLPPAIGMMTGLSYLKFFGFYLKKTHHKTTPRTGSEFFDKGTFVAEKEDRPFNIFDKIARAEWDTLLFFYGVILCVGGLGLIGYLSLLSQTVYVGMGPTIANVLVGLLSAVVDNIPVMFAVLTMNPDMSLGEWLLVTMTAGVGGSLLSVGSAAGVALMGASKGRYTFFGHLKWTPVIALGYGASILVHLWINAKQFDLPANPLTDF